jgi:hypothetical protein
MTLAQIGCFLSAVCGLPASGDDGADGLWTAPLSWLDEAAEPARAAAGSDGLVDFDHVEAAVRASLLVFSENFEADPEPGFGVFLRAPMPWSSLQERGWTGKVEVDAWDEGYFGVWVEFEMSSIDRTFDPPLLKPDGSIFFVGAGIDYTFYRDDTWQLMLKLGGQYGNFGGVTDTVDGAAVTVGLTLGVQASEGLWITWTPEVALAERGDHIIFNHLGFLYKF